MINDALLRHGRACCLVRGHDRHLFGDITDTLLVGQVDFGNLVSCEEDAVLAIHVFACLNAQDVDARQGRHDEQTLSALV
jgi:hypothetical protein